MGAKTYYFTVLFIRMYRYPNISLHRIHMALPVRGLKTSTDIRIGDGFIGHKARTSTGWIMAKVHGRNVQQLDSSNEGNFIIRIKRSKTKTSFGTLILFLLL